MAPEGVPEVAIRGLSWGAMGSWATFFAVLSAIGIIVRAIGPAKIIELIFNRNRELRVEKQEEGETLLERVAALEARALRAETVNMYLTGAVTQTLSALRQADPTNSAIGPASDLIEMAIAAGGDSAFAKGLAKLADVKGVGTA